MQYLLLAANLALKLMEKLPNYDQKKKESFYNKTRRLEIEWSKTVDNGRDDDFILDLEDELGLLVKTFYKEIKS